MIDDFRPTSEPHAPHSTAAEPAQNAVPSLDFRSNPSEVPTENATVTDEVDGAKLEALMGKPDEAFPGGKVPSKRRLLGLPGHSRAEWWSQLSRKQHALIIIASLLVLGVGSGSAAYFVMHGRKPEAVAIAPPAKKKPQPPVSTTVASTLTGLQVDPGVNQRPVTAVMVENSLAARPQSGLDQAGVVFEAIAEAGITRFMALYQDTQPDYIGPVRSVRPYYEQWALGFDASIAHVGGSPEALANMKTWSIKDLDQFYNSDAYHRVSSRYAPHNVYTSISSLNQVETSKGYTSSSFTGFLRKKEAPSQQPNAASINFNISTSEYAVHYDYDAATNSYKRNLAGQPHMVVDSAGNKKQITPKVVIALVMSYSLESDGYHSSYGATGTGQMFVFQDGTVTPGTWSKAGNNDQFQFHDNNGHPLALNPGQTWLTAVGSAGDVSYQ